MKKNSLNRFAIVLLVAVTFLLDTFLLGAFLPGATVTKGQEEPHSPRKIALLIGVSDYFHKKMEDLRFCENDALSMAKQLGQLGFETTTVTGKSATRVGLKKQIDVFMDKASKLESSDLVLVLFSGHGQQLLASAKQRIELDGKIIEIPRKSEIPYFCPRDAVPFDKLVHTLDGMNEVEIEEKFNLISLNYVIAALDKKSNSLNNLLIVDACRSNPAKGKAAGVTGSTTKDLPNGISMLFGARSGQKSWESSDERIQHGVMTYYLLKGLQGGAKNKRNQVTWMDLVSYVKNEVSIDGWKMAGNRDRKQNPHFIGSTDSVAVLGSGAALSAPYMSPLDIDARFQLAEKILADLQKDHTAIKTSRVVLPEAVLKRFEDESNAEYAKRIESFREGQKTGRIATFHQAASVANGMFGNRNLARDHLRILADASPDGRLQPLYSEFGIDAWYVANLLIRGDIDRSDLKITASAMKQVEQSVDLLRKEKSNGNLWFESAEGGERQVLESLREGKESQSNSTYMYAGYSYSFAKEFLKLDAAKIKRRKDYDSNLAAFLLDERYLLANLSKNDNSSDACGIAVPLVVHGRYDLLDRCLAKMKIAKTSTLMLAAETCLNLGDVNRSRQYLERVTSDEFFYIASFFRQNPDFLNGASNGCREGYSLVWQMFGRLKMEEKAFQMMKELSGAQQLIAKAHFVRGLLMDVDNLKGNLTEWKRSR